MMGGSEDSDQICHKSLLFSEPLLAFGHPPLRVTLACGPSRRRGGGRGKGSRTVDGVAINGIVNVGRNWRAHLLGKLAQQPSGTSKQRHATQQLRRQPQVGERRATDARAVQRQRAPENGGMYAANRLEEPEMRPLQPLLLGDADDNGRAWVALLVDGMSQAGNETPRCPRLGDGAPGKLVPLPVGCWQIALHAGEDVRE